MNHSSFNRRNLKPKKSHIKSFLLHLLNFIKKGNRKTSIERNTTKKAFRSPNKVAGITKKEIKKIVSKIFFFLIAIFIVTFISWVLFSSSIFKIKNISINIENKKYSESINKIIATQKEQNRLFWKQDNIFLFSKNYLIDSINKVSNGFFYNIIVTKKFPNRIDVKLKERSPKIVFITDQYKFYFDEDAKMILKSKINVPSVVIPKIEKEVTPKKEVTVVVDTKNNEEDILKELMNNQLEKDSGIKAVDLRIPDNNENLKDSLSFLNKEDVFKGYNFPEVYLGQKIELKDYDINKDVILFISNLNTKLPNKSIKIKKLYLETINDLKLTVTTEVGYDIYFNTGKDIDQQIEYLGIVIKDKIKDDIKKIKYIDLRFDSKIFYK